MKGSLIINFDTENTGSVTVKRNSTSITYFTNYGLNIDDLYSVPVENGDVITFQISTYSLIDNIQYTYNLKRYDYTNDDNNGDFGIKQTVITSGSSLSVTGVTFTITGATNPNAYSFKYVLEANISNGCWNMGNPATSNCGYRRTSLNGVVRDVKYYDEKVYVCGNFNIYSGQTIPTGITINNLNGTLFSGFTGLGAIGGLGPLNIEPYRDGSGKMLVTCDTYNSQAVFGLVRLNSNGTKDTSWSGLTTSVGAIYDTEILSDNKILCSGTISSINGVSRKGICKLNSDGSLDTSFGGVSGFTSTLQTNAEVYDIDVQSDGKVLCIGLFDAYSGTSIIGVARLNSNGTLDTTFNSPLQIHTLLYGAIKQLSDGKILISGQLKYNNRYYYMLRLNSNGSVDTTFNLPYSSDIADGWITDFEVLSDGKIIAFFLGVFVNQQGNDDWIGRLNSDGSIDTSFNKCYVNNNNLVTQETIAVDEVRKIIYAGGGWVSAQNQPGGFLAGSAYQNFVRLDWDGTISVCS